MTRDYINHELQEMQSQIQSKWHIQEQVIEEAKQLRDRQKQRDAEKDAARARDVLNLRQLDLHQQYINFLLPLKELTKLLSVRSGRKET